MKHIALFTILVGLFFGTLTSVAALPPLQYYVRWATPLLYTCAYSSFYGEYQLSVAQTQLDYEVPYAAQMTENDIVDNSNGHFVVAQDTESAWMNFIGTRAHTTYNIQSATYPITLHVILTTYVNGVAVYQSTFSARCTGNSHGALSAIITNIANPLTTGIVQQPGVIGTHP